MRLFRFFGFFLVYLVSVSHIYIIIIYLAQANNQTVKIKLHEQVRQGWGTDSYSRLYIIHMCILCQNR